MERAELIRKITEVTNDVTMITLSNKCGVYFGLMENGKTPLVNRFVGKNSYASVLLNRLPTKTIELIYEDLKEDFFTEE